MDLLQQQRSSLGKYVIVCEGETDRYILNALWHQFAPQINVQYAAGTENLRLLCDALTPSIYIEDRDFKETIAYAQSSFTNRKRHTMWLRYEIECYLLYADWIMGVIEAIPSRRNSRFSQLPQTEPEVEQQIIQIAEALVLEHACKHTLHDIDTFVGNPRIAFQTRSANTWSEVYVVDELERIKGNLIAGANHPDLTQDQVTARLQAHIDNYSRWAKTIEDVRFHFAGSAIFEQLISTQYGYWQINMKWQNFVKEVVTHAQKYVDERFARSDKLSHDPRLGDLGLLATKLLESPTPV